MNPIYAAQAAADDALPNGGVTADFSAETWWLTLIKAVFIVAFLIVSVMMALWVERRGLARMQTRLGPNVNGPLGLLQAVADAGKLIMKEDFWLKGAEKVIYLLAPLIAAFSAFMVYAVIPFGPQVSIFGHSTPLQLTDFPVAVLYIWPSPPSASTGSSWAAGPRTPPTRSSAPCAAPLRSSPTS